MVVSFFLPDRRWPDFAGRFYNIRQSMEATYQRMDFSCELQSFCDIPVDDIFCLWCFANAGGQGVNHRVYHAIVGDDFCPIHVR